MFSLCCLLYVFVVVFLLKSVGSNSGKNKSDDSNYVQRMKRMKKVNRMFGQGKILISLVQIVASMPSVLVGNKLDLVEGGRLDEAHLDRFVAQHGFGSWHDASALTGEGIDEAFRALVTEVVTLSDHPEIV